MEEKEKEEEKEQLSVCFCFEQRYETLPRRTIFFCSSSLQEPFFIFVISVEQKLDYKVA
jgi:hypothetical protein